MPSCQEVVSAGSSERARTVIGAIAQNHQLQLSDVLLWVFTSTGIPLGEGHVAWKPMVPAVELVHKEAIYWATKSLHLMTVVCPSMSALTHKVDPDEPVSNLIAVVHQMLDILYNDPNQQICLIRNT